MGFEERYGVRNEDGRGGAIYRKRYSGGSRVKFRIGRIIWAFLDPPSPHRLHVWSMSKPSRMKPIYSTPNPIMTP